MGLFSKKYNINPEENMPQIVDGPPPFMNENNAPKMVFCANEGGYGGPFEFYFVEKINNEFRFKSGYFSGEMKPTPDNESDYDISIENNIDLNSSFEKMVKAKVNDPFWEKLICDYLKQEINKSDTVLKIIFKDLTKYADIFNEFTKYLVQKTYDIPGAISVEGYTAKKISELNLSFKATDVYTFLNYLREKPEEAKDVIKKGFANKDAIPPVKNKAGYLKLVHIPFHGCYGIREELEAQKVNPLITYHEIKKGQSLMLDRVNVIVDDLTTESVSLTIPYQAGIIAKDEDYRNQQPSKFMLKKGEKIMLYLDVCDAMESWDISFVKEKSKDENNKLKRISAIEKIGIPTKQREKTILFVSKESAVIDNQKEMINNEKFEKISNLICQNRIKFIDIANQQTQEFLDAHKSFDDKSKTIMIELEQEDFVLNYYTGTETDQYISDLINQIIGILKF